MIDTHTHLYLSDYDIDGGGESAVRRAVDNGVKKMIFPNVDLTTIDPMESLSQKFPDNTRCAMGIHPTEINHDWETAVRVIQDRLASNPSYVAVGEIGLDLYWDKTFLREQMLAFEKQIELAENFNLPVIIHCRDGLNETLEVISKFKDVKAVFHSFGGSVEDVDLIRRYGDFYFGINGIVTFKNSKLREVLPIIGVDRILLETDSPYLTPAPHRGKRNESAYLPFICAHIAQSLSLSNDEVEKKTTENACCLFKNL